MIKLYKHYDILLTNTISLLFLCLVISPMRNQQPLIDLEQSWELAHACYNKKNMGDFV